jgi:hypothetical protein
MLKFTAATLLCAASIPALAQPQPETFVIHAGVGGREPTIVVPVGAVATFSASAAEALVGVSGPRVEAMRLSGDVLINVVGAGQPIRIKADSVVLELTADEGPGARKAGLNPVRADRQLRSTEIIVGDDDSQTFVGHVVFTVPTDVGAMQITAERIERKAAVAAGV